ncbi:TetR/AcrR family transcriptional regulator [Tomitella biformata]|uniref:TetR/AcrR family transcriptional regulator n=1 Tax=Tomitella biformata TaxID=630403 RepID=UPI0004677EEE|nr:TetR/AcrR family transcriptional regulator [Tomitella biformata]
MLELRNDELTEADPLESAILDAAASCVLDLGPDRMTIAEIARRANLSRPTIYRRWPSVEAIAVALLTREILTVAGRAPWQGDNREALVARAVAVADLVGRSPVFEELLLASPQMFMTYTFQRLGTSQRALIDVIAGALELGQAGGSIRAGDPRQLAAMVLLTVQSTIQSARMVEPILDAAALRAELTHLLNGYLRP